MKRFLCFTFLALTCFMAHGQRFVKGNVGTLADLVALNPNDVHTNVFVSSPNTNSAGGIFYYDPNSAAVVNAYDTLKPTSFAGRWRRYQQFLASTDFPNQGVSTNFLQGNASGATSWSAVNVGTSVTGTMVVGNGGTGATTLSGILYGNGASSFTAGNGTAGTISKFSASSPGLANSIMTESGTTITIGGGITLTGAQTIQTSSGILTVTGTGGLTLTSGTSNTLLTQNSVNVFTSVGAGAIVNTLYLSAGNAFVGATSATSTSKLNVVSSSNAILTVETTGTDRSDINIIKSSGTIQGWALSVAGTANGYGVTDKFFHVTDTTSGNVRFVLDKSGRAGFGGQLVPSYTVDITGTLNSTTSITDGGLTATRLTFAGTAGLLSDSANLTWVSPALTIGVAASTTGALKMTGATSGTVTTTVAATAGTWTMVLPTAVGTAGFQLTDAAGDGVTSWAAAASSRDQKNIISRFDDTKDALQKVSSAPVYKFKYKTGMGTGDQATEYVGIMADESPWAMHFNNKILNPVNTFGYTVLAIQELNKEIEMLKNELRELKTKGQ